MPLDVEWIRVVRVEHTASAIWRLRRWLVAGLLAMAALAGTHAAAASTLSSTQLPEVRIGNAIRPVPESFLGLSTETVRTHTKRILAKLGADTRTQADAIGIRTGLIE